MTNTERRLATRVAIAWVLASILSSTIRISMRLLTHKQIYVVSALLVEWSAVLQALAGVVLVIYTWRAERFRAWRFAAFATAVFAALETVRVVATTTASKAAYGAIDDSKRRVLIGIAVDMQRFFILVAVAVGATLLARWHERSVASAEQRAAAEAALAEARVRHLRTQVQPALIRHSLRDIETLLNTDRAAAEAALLNLSDFLRIALLRARDDVWSSEQQAEYDRLSHLVATGAA